MCPNSAGVPENIKVRKFVTVACKLNVREIREELKMSKAEYLSFFMNAVFKIDAAFAHSRLKELCVTRFQRCL